MRARRTHEVNEGRALGSRTCRIVRPPERLQYALAEEHVSAQTRGPLALDQAHQVQVVEVAERRGRAIDEHHAGLAALRGECLAFDPAADRARQLIDLPEEVVVVAMRGGQAVEDREHRATRAQVPLAKRIVQPDGAAERAQELAERPQQRARRLLDGQRRKHVDHGRGRAGRIGGLRRVPSRVARRLERSALPLGRQRFQSRRVAAVVERRQPDGQCGNGVGRELEVRGAEHEVRRSEQGDERRRGEAGGDGGEDQVQRGGERLGGQRQRVARLERHAARGEHAPREIHVRQRPPNHDANSIQCCAGRQSCVAAPLRVHRTNPPHQVRQLIFPIAAEKAAGARLLLGHQQHRSLEFCLGRWHLGVFYARQQVVQPLVQARGKLLFSGHEIDGLESRQSREEIEVGCRQSVGILGPVADRNDGRTIWRG